MRTLLPLLMLSGCLIGPRQTRDRYDQDGDGSLWPDDCDDSDASISPDTPESFDGIDNDCDGSVDEAGDTGDTGLPPIQGTEVFPLGSTWHYLDASDPPSTWLDDGYPFENWPSGSGELGYGDGDEATVLYDGGSPGQRIVRVAFMTTVTLADAPPAEVLLDVIVDDGFVLYFNGEEVERYNLPLGTVDQDTLAVSDIEGNKRQRFTVDASLLQQGDNVLAASVHQVTRQSDDLSFDLAIWYPE